MWRHHNDIIQVLDFDEADMVLDERGMTNQAARIIALVARKGDQVLERFVTSLRQSNHEHLANVLVMPKEAEHNGEMPETHDDKMVDISQTTISNSFQIHFLERKCIISNKISLTYLFLRGSIDNNSALV